MHRIIDLVCGTQRIGCVWLHIGEKFAMGVWQPDGIVDTITDGKDHRLQGNLDVRPGAARRRIAVSGDEDIFFDLEPTYPSVDVGEHPGGRSEKAEQHAARAVGWPGWWCRRGHLRYQRVRILAHRFKTRTQTGNFLT